MNKPTRRNKSIDCVLCEKEQTRNRSGVCVSCLQLIKDGESFRRLKSTSDGATKLERSRTATYFSFFHNQGQAQGYDGKEELRRRWQKASLAMTLGEREYTYHIPAAWRELPEAPLDYGGNGYGVIGSKSDGSSEIYILVAPEGQAARLLELYNVTLDLLATAYAEGRKDGENLIGRLVDGDLTVNEIVDPAARKKRR